MAKIENLEILRGLAACEVVVCHIIGKVQIPIFKESLFFNLIGNWGTEAVIIFFILSGIVIGISQENKPKNRLEFIKNRIIRIFPIFIIGILLALITHILYYNTLPDTKTIVGSFLFLSTTQSWIIPTLEYNPVIWSLTFEMFFYLLFSITINKNKNNNLLYLWCITSLICIPFYYYSGISSSILKHFIGMFAFSSIWLVGYFIHKFRYYFKFNSINALFSLLSLPLISRLEITNEYYDVIKYLIFAIISVPFFGYILNPTTTTKSNNLIYFQIIINFFFIFILFYNSKSLFITKIIYSIFPFFTFIIGFKYFISIILLKTKGIFIFLGDMSYSLYILHYPILFLIMYYLKDYLFIIPFILMVIIFPICLFFERFYQNAITNFFKK